MCIDDQIITDLGALTHSIRDKARYMSLIESDPNKRNYEQSQTPSAVLTEVATKLESLIAKHYIYNSLFASEVEQAAFEKIKERLSRQCRTAIRREIARKNATVRRQT